MWDRYTWHNARYRDSNLYRLRMFTDLQIMSDFSVVQYACLVTRKNMQAG